MRRWQKSRFAEQRSAKLESWTTGTPRFAASLLTVLAIQLVGTADAFAQNQTATITINKNCNGATGTFGFLSTFPNPDSSFNVQCGTSITRVVPVQGDLITYFVQETTIPSTFTLTNIVCSGFNPGHPPVISLPLSIVGITALPNDTITCTFTNTPKPPGNGTIEIEKIAEGAGNLPFEFVGNLGTFDLTNGSSTTFSVPSGFYFVRETQPPSPWSLTGLTCEVDPQSFEFHNVADRTVAIFLAADGSVRCTFTNTRTPANTGEIVVQKLVSGMDPTFGGTPFTFIDDFPGSPQSFVLKSGDSFPSGQIPAGAIYHVSEFVPPGWSLALQCRDSTGVLVGTVAGSTATIPLAAGQRITCTFIDTFVPSNNGHIVVKKVTIPSTNRTSFCFESNLQTGDFSLANNQQKDFGPLRPGTYFVEEFPGSGWITDVNCVSALGVSQISYPSNKKAVITLVDGDTVTCTYTNRK